MPGLINQYVVNKQQIAQIQEPFEEITENSSSNSDEDAYVWKKYEDETRKRLLDSMTLSVSSVIDIIREKEEYDEYEREMEQIKENDKAMTKYLREMRTID